MYTLDAETKAALAADFELAMAVHTAWLEELRVAQEGEDYTSSEHCTVHKDYAFLNVNDE